jgi:hypothetical protein
MRILKGASSPSRLDDNKRIGTPEAALTGGLLSFKGATPILAKVGRMSGWGHERRLTHPIATSVFTLNADICLRCNI